MLSWWIRMTCKGCEERREMMRNTYERAKERMQLCIKRLTSQDTGSDERTNESDVRTEQTNGSDRGSE